MYNSKRELKDVLQDNTISTPLARRNRTSFAIQHLCLFGGWSLFTLMRVLIRKNGFEGHTLYQKLPLLIYDGCAMFEKVYAKRLSVITHYQSNILDSKHLDADAKFAHVIEHGIHSNFIYHSEKERVTVLISLSRKINHYTKLLYLKKGTFPTYCILKSLSTIDLTGVADEAFVKEIDSQVSRFETSLDLTLDKLDEIAKQREM